MRRLASLIVLTTTIASAQPSIPPPRDPNTLNLATGAHNAALHGDCDRARSIARMVRERDEDYYRAVVAADPELATCHAAAVAPPAESEEAVESPDPALPPPPAPSAGMVAGEILLGTAVGLAGVAVLAAVGAKASTPGDDDEGPSGGVVMGALVGALVFPAVGVMIAGSAGPTTGSKAGAVVGSLVGSVAGFYALALESKVGLSAAVAIAVSMPAIGATLGYNLRREWKSGTKRVSVGVVPMPTEHGFTVSLAHGAF